MKPFITMGAAASILALALLSGCNEDDLAGTSTETVTGKTTGLIFLADGKPAAGARIRAYPVGYRPFEDSGKTALFKTTTNDKGRFYLDDLAKGEYNILGDLDGKVSYQDSVPVTGSPILLASDTLMEPGAVSGFVALQPGDPLTTVTLQLLGTQVFSNVDARGFFTLPALAPGRYRAAVSTTLEDYSVQYAPIEVQSGWHDTLADTLGPIFYGIPQVLGVRAAFDTLRQTVQLTWPEVGYSGTDDYLVFRDRKGAIDRSVVAIAAVKDTQYIDTLPQSFPPPSEKGFSVNEWEYRVVIRDKFGKRGRSFGSLPVQAPTAAFATTYMEARIANALPQGSSRWQASIGDTVFVILHASNRTRAHRLLRWFQVGKNEPLRSVAPGTSEVIDTLRIVCPGEPTTMEFRPEVADEAGTEWKLGLVLEVVVDAPIVAMPPNTTGKPGEPIKVFGLISNKYGRIVKMEWKFGSGPWSAPTLSNDTAFLAPESGLSRFPVILKVTDDDGLSASDTTVVDVTPWREGASMPEAASGPAVVTLGNLIYAIGGSKVSPNSSTPMAAVQVYDAVAGNWSTRSSMPVPRSNFAAVALNGKIYVMGGHKGGPFISETGEYDPATNQWRSMANIPHRRIDADAAVHAGRIYVLGGYVLQGDGTAKPTDQIDVFDPASDTWSSFASPMPVYGALKTAVIGDEVYAFAIGQDRKGQFAKYDFLSDTWTALGVIPNDKEFRDVRPTDYSVVTHGGKLLVVGGSYPSSPSFWQTWGRDFTRKVFEYSPVEQDWDELVSVPREVSGCGLAAIGDRIFLLGGMVSTANYYNNPDYSTDKWSESNEVRWRVLP